MTAGLLMKGARSRCCALACASDRIRSANDRAPENIIILTCSNKLNDIHKRCIPSCLSPSFICLIEVLYEVPFIGTTTHFHSNRKLVISFTQINIENQRYIDMIMQNICLLLEPNVKGLVRDHAPRCSIVSAPANNLSERPVYN